MLIKCLAGKISIAYCGHGGNHKVKGIEVLVKLRFRHYLGGEPATPSLRALKLAQHEPDASKKVLSVQDNEEEEG